MDIYPSAHVQPDITRPREEKDDERDPPEEAEDTTSPPGSTDVPMGQLIPCTSVQGESSRTVSSTTSSSSTTNVESGTPPGVISLDEGIPVNRSFSYDKDDKVQKLVAVIGRDFDTPVVLADSLQKMYKSFGDCVREGVPSVKFLGYQIKRKELLSNRFKMEDLEKHDLIVMCYNASEARILLTGSDGFYSSLLKQVERTLGPNKVAFVIFNYQTRYLHNPGDEEVLLDRNLSERLKSQEALQQYLKEEQILSWTRVPLKTHVVKLICLAEKEKNPIPYGLDHCVTL